MRAVPGLMLSAQAKPFKWYSIEDGGGNCQQHKPQANFRGCNTPVADGAKKLDKDTFSNPVIARDPE